MCSTEADRQTEKETDMILKVEYHEEQSKENPHHTHTRILEVYDFHIETRGVKDANDDPHGAHEIVYHTVNNGPGVLRVGFDKQSPDHVYVMDKGKTVDHMRFYAN
jgi:phosphoenolpyruvate synthase/pyruvate phosphate dikinase